MDLERPPTTRLIDLADMIYARSELFHLRASQIDDDRVLDPVLFGMQEGKIAQANRQKETLFLFAAMQRHLDTQAYLAKNQLITCRR